MANLTLQVLRVILTHMVLDTIKWVYITKNNSALFVKRGFVTEEEFKELTGQEYQDVV